jgi:hypothetical protein
MISMPIPVFVLMIVLVLYVVFRDDMPKVKRAIKIQRFKHTPVDACGFYEELKLREEAQVPEYN